METIGLPTQESINEFNDYIEDNAHEYEVVPDTTMPTTQGNFATAEDRYYESMTASNEAADKPDAESVTPVCIEVITEPVVVDNINGAYGDTLVTVLVVSICVLSITVITDVLKRVK